MARIACLHVLHSAVPTTAKSNFGTAKSSFSTSCGLTFLVSILRNRPSTHVARFIQTWRRKSVVSLSFNIKRADLCNRDQYDQQRSINLFHWCIFEISQFYLCFLTVLEHFYMPLSFLSGVSALSKLKSIVSSFMTSRRNSLGVRFFPGYNTRVFRRLLLC